MFRQDTWGHPKNPFLITTTLVRDVRVALGRASLRFKPYALRVFLYLPRHSGEQGPDIRQWRSF